MNPPGAKAYRPWTPEIYARQAHAPAAKLPEDDLVFFLLDVVPKLDLSRFMPPTKTRPVAHRPSIPP